MFGHTERELRTVSLDKQVEAQALEKENKRRKKITSLETATHLLTNTVIVQQKPPHR
jgi:hypothetical protein